MDATTRSVDGVRAHGADEPLITSASGWTPGGTARAVVATAIGTAVREFEIQAPLAVAGDPDGVHQARVATRRLRSDLRTFAPLLDEAWCETTRAELERLADALGAVRDRDVLRDSLLAAIRDAGVDPSDATPLLDRLDGEQQRARDEMIAVIGDDRTGALVDRLREAAADPPTTARALGRADRRVRPLVRRPWQRLLRAVDGLDDEPSVPELHRVRLRAKRARYAAEAVVDVHGREARRFAKAVAGVQQVLGELNDAEVALEWLCAAVPDLPPRAAFAAGRLVQHLAGVADAHRHGWEHSLAAARKRSRWLR